jgi:hypothetical protein
MPTDTLSDDDRAELIAHRVVNLLWGLGDPAIRTVDVAGQAGSRCGVSRKSRSAINPEHVRRLGILADRGRGR